MAVVVLITGAERETVRGTRVVPKDVNVDAPACGNVVVDVSVT